jgi:DNA-binding transcriptional LysR family regulator
LIMAEIDIGRLSMNLRQLRYFVAVAEELHFRRAAERLCIAQPAVTAQIKALESSLGGSLIKRSTRRVELTDAGKMLFEHAQHVLSQVELASCKVRNSLRGEAGVLRLVYSGNAATTGILMRGMRAFHNKHKDVEIQTAEMDPAQQEEALVSGHAHAAFTTTLARPPKSSLVVRRLGTWPLQLAMPIDHPLSRLSSIRVDDIVSHPFVVYATHVGDDGTAVLRHVFGFDPIIARRVSGALMVSPQVGAGIGLALLPQSMERAVAGDGVVLRPVQSARANMDLALLSLANKVEPLTERFLEVATSEFMLQSTASVGAGAWVALRAESGL